MPVIGRVTAANNRWHENWPRCARLSSLSGLPAFRPRLIRCGQPAGRNAVRAYRQGAAVRLIRLRGAGLCRRAGLWQGYRAQGMRRETLRP